MKKKSGGTFFTLSFSVSSQYDYDTMSVAHCYPYTYSDLNRYLSRLIADPKKRSRITRKNMCYTIAGNICDILTITTFASS